VKVKATSFWIVLGIEVIVAVTPAALAMGKERRPENRVWTMNTVMRVNLGIFIRVIVKELDKGWGKFVSTEYKHQSHLVLLEANPFCI